MIFLDFYAFVFFFSNHRTRQNSVSQLQIQELSRRDSLWGADSALAALKGSPDLAQGTEGTWLSPGLLPQSDDDICTQPGPAGCTLDSLHQHTSAGLMLTKPVSPCKKFYCFMMAAHIRNFDSCRLVCPVRNVTFSSTSK